MYTRRITTTYRLIVGQFKMLALLRVGNARGHRQASFALASVGEIQQCSHGVAVLNTIYNAPPANGRMRTNWFPRCTLIGAPELSVTRAIMDLVVATS